MGGTFDPVHIGHLVIAEEARYQVELDRVMLVPSARPPHKTGTSQAGPEHRLAMLELAVRSNPGLEVSDLEVRREGLSFTIETLRELHRIYGSEAGLFFITGADAILEIMTWKDPEGLLTESQFVVATRPGYPLDRLVEALPEFNSEGEKAAENILFIETPALEISSTEIRNRVAERRPYRYLVPEAVWQYIEENGLYG
jgi:nicotinate-nucleotide adenylyltransferase